MGGKPRFGSFLVIEPSSVMIFQIDLDCITFQPTECDAPVSARVYRITAFVAADECMKTETRQVHVFRPRCIVERAQNVGDASRVLYTEPAPVSGREEAFQGLVSERPDHARKRKAIPYNCQALPYDSQAPDIG